MYNKAIYLDECVSSIINQTFVDIEIILIDDGSTDNSFEICKKWEAVDSRIKSFTKENTGVSDTRNTALKEVRGEFVSFVDADDYLELDTYQKCYDELLQTSADACYFGRRSVNVRADLSPVITIDKNLLYKKEQIQGEFVKFFLGYLPGEPTRNYMSGSACTAVYKRSLLIENSIFFPQIRQNEDGIFNLNFCLYAENISVIKDILYCNRVLTTSVSRCYDPYRLDTFKMEYWEKRKFADMCPTYTKARLRVDSNFINMVSRCIQQEIRYRTENGLSQMYLRIYKHLNDNDLKEVIKVIDKTDFPFKRKALLFMMKHKMVISLCIYYHYFERWFRK